MTNQVGQDPIKGIPFLRNVYGPTINGNFDDDLFVTILEDILRYHNGITMVLAKLNPTN